MDLRTREESLSLNTVSLVKQYESLQYKMLDIKGNRCHICAWVCVRVCVCVCACVCAFGLDSGICIQQSDQSQQLIMAGANEQGDQEEIK